MAVIVEFTLPSDSFPFGRTTSGGENLRVQLERVVPIGEARIPFAWATRGDFDDFEHVLRNSDIVKHVEALTRVGESVLDYTEWYEDNETFLNGVADAGASIMEAHGDSA